VASKKLKEMLNKAIAMELQVAIQYMWQHVLATGVDSAAVADVFKESAITEMKHAEALAERLAYLDGNPTTKPGDLFKDTSPPVKWGDNFIGAILPAARHKGYALALVADVFAGALTGGRCNGDVIEGENGVFMQAINPEAFIPREEFEKRVDTLIRACRFSSPRPGFDKVRIPGDPEREAEEKAWKFGIPIDEELWKELVELGEKYGVDVYKIVKS